MSIANTHFGADSIAECLKGKKSIFFIGIGGINMSSLAHIAYERGYKVGGSDKTKTALTERLQNCGIDVKYGHNADNIKGYDAVVYTVAIASDNPELVYAKENGLPCISRADFLGYIMSGYTHRIGVSGMHGKSTCTSMLAHLFISADKDPTVMSGVELAEMNGAYRIGKTDNFVFEACEYMDSFLSFYPSIAVILNIEMDHVDYFHSIEQIKNSFSAFAGKTLVGNDDKTIVVNYDDERVYQISKEYGGKVVSVGIKSTGADFRAINISYQCGHPQFDVLKHGKFVCRINLAVAGEHNIYNALAAYAVADTCGIPAEEIKIGLESFTGAKRRMEFKGKVNGADVYDDYAHHPTEVRSTLEGVAKMGYERVWCVYQPHTYSRTAELAGDFAVSFDCADRVIMADIYAAREVNTYGISSKRLADMIGEKAEYIDSFAGIAKKLRENVSRGDIVVVMGAGDIYKVFAELDLCEDKK